MSLAEGLDLLMVVLGVTGCVGTLRGWPWFMNESRMENLVEMFGRRTLRLVVAGGYLLVALLGASRLLA